MVICTSVARGIFRHAQAERFVRANRLHLHDRGARVRDVRIVAGRVFDDVWRAVAVGVGAVAGWAHLHELRIELAEDFDQVGLRGQDGVDVLIDSRHFIEAGAEQLDAAPGEQLPGRAHQVKDCIALVRLITRPAPCDALVSDSGEPLQRTT